VTNFLFCVNCNRDTDHGGDVCRRCGFVTPEHERPPVSAKTRRKARRDGMATAPRLGEPSSEGAATAVSAERAKEFFAAMRTVVNNGFSQT
jgi:hypothetical protein